ncbi:MAG: hypothetical protein R2710_18180 [Acidimicrobiales bacterium]
MPLQTGLSATVIVSVTDDDTAIALGSGTVPVLGTPGCWRSASKRPRMPWPVSWVRV